MFGKGISREGDILDLAANCGVVIKSGSWYAYNNEKIGQGRENAKKYFLISPLYSRNFSSLSNTTLFLFL